MKNFRYNGERVFDIIKRGRDIYSGEFAERGPDIVCIHSKSKYIVSRFFEFGSKKTITVHPVWSGTHDKNGIFLTWDGEKDIERGKRIKATIQDVTPTILHIYGFPIPEDMDGRVLTEIFKKNSEYVKRRITFQKVGEKRKVKEKIEKLKHLGKIM